MRESIPFYEESIRKDKRSAEKKTISDHNSQIHTSFRRQFIQNIDSGKHQLDQYH